MEIVEARKNKPAQVAQVSGGRGNTGGLSQAARDLGLPRDTVRRAVRISKLDPAAKEAAKASGLDDNQSALLDRKTEKAGSLPGLGASPCLYIRGQRKL